MKKLCFLSVAAMLALNFTACTSNDEDTPNVDTSAKTIYAGDSVAITGANTISSANEFVAFPTSGKYVKAFHVGKTTVLVNKKHSIPITVKGRYNTYNDPIMEWGCSRSYVEQRQTQGTKAANSTNETLFYENANRAILLAYNFENGKLASVATLVSTTHSSELAHYLTERYLMLPQKRDGDTYFAGGDALAPNQMKTFVIMKVQNYKYLYTFYTDASKYTSASSAKAIKSMLRALEAK